jgi:hypothetical protein
MLKLPNSFTYVQFHPLAFTVKLYIEMTMAELITKIVRKSQTTGDHSSGTPHVAADLHALTSRNSHSANDTLATSPSQYECRAEAALGKSEGGKTEDLDEGIWKAVNITHAYGVENV